MDSPALGKAELVVGGCASWTFSKGGRRKLLRTKAKKQLSEQHEHHAQRYSRPRTCTHPAQLAASTHTPSGHVNWRSCSVYLGSNS